MTSGHTSERLSYLHMGRVKRIWYLSPIRAAKVQASLRICAVSPEPPLLAHTSSESRGTFRQKARSLAPLNGWAWAVKICHDGMLEDTNSLYAVHIITQCILVRRGVIHVIFSWAQIGRSAIFGREIGVPDREIFSRQNKIKFNVKNCLLASA